MVKAGEAQKMGSW